MIDKGAEVGSGSPRTPGSRLLKAVCSFPDSRNLCRRGASAFRECCQRFYTRVINTRLRSYRVQLVAI